MRIFFSTSFRGKKLYQESIDLVRHTIESFTSIDLISPEKEDYTHFLPKSLQKKLTDPTVVHTEAMQYGIAMAEACVFEVSYESFQIGYEVAKALQDKKPVLCLSVNEDFSKRIRNDYFFGAQYNPNTVHGLVQDFLAHVRQRSLSKRFNLFLYPHQLDYLEMAAKEHSMNKSEYLRHLVNTDKITRQ